MIKCNINKLLGGFIMLQKQKAKTESKIESKTESKPKSKARSKIIPKKTYVQYAGKEIQEEVLMEKFKAEWLKENKITAIKDLKIYYKIDDEKAYFVVNEVVTIIIDFE